MPGKSKPGSTDDEAVRVIIRCRPMSKDEIADKRKKVVQMDTTMGTVRVVKPGEDPASAKTYTFDRVFDEDCTQREVYEIVARPIVDAAINGFNGTIFAYGQTGTGKSFSMVGVYEKPELRGIIPNSFVHVFDNIAKNAENAEFLVRASFLEIYNEDVRDLLSKNYQKKLDLKEHPEMGVYVKGLSMHVVKSFDEIDRVMQKGNDNRQVAETKMNAVSSRSHSIFTVTIESSTKGPDGQDHIKVGKLNMVDLAGSERQSKTGAEGDRLKEGVKINMSLSALGNVISALVDPKSTHVPYRDSKLTRLLQDSLGGNSKTVMIAAIGPAGYNYDETMSTLRYANRAKSIKNKPKINEDPKDAMLRQFQEEIEKLKAQLASGGAPIVEYSYYSDDDDDDAGGSGESDGGGDGGGGDGKRKAKSKSKSKSKSKKKGKGKRRKKTAQYTEEEIKERERLAAEETERMKAARAMSEEERRRVEAELKARQEKIEEQRREREAVAAKLKAMEEKVLVGGISVVELAEKQKRQLEQERILLEEKEREDARLRQLLLAKQEEMEVQQEQYDSLAQEADVKTKKLKKLYSKVQQAKNELELLQEDGRNEKEALVEEIRDLNRDLKLCQIIIDNFIPPEEVDRVRKNAEWDDEKEEYRLAPTSSRPDSTIRIPRPRARADSKRPICEFALYAIRCGANHPRFKPDNILQLELDMPDRTTTDYEGPSVAPRVQAALQAALAQEDDMEFNAQENLPGLYRSYDSVGGQRPITRSKSSRRM